MPSEANVAFWKLIEALSDKDENHYRNALEILYLDDAMPTYKPPGEPHLKEWLVEIGHIALSPDGEMSQIRAVLTRAGFLFPL